MSTTSGDPGSSAILPSGTRVPEPAHRGLGVEPVVRPVAGWWQTADARAVAILILITTLISGFRFYYDNWLSEFDVFTFFLPNFGYVGDRLRDLEIPAWNPYLSSGTPMAGDASGGWMYLPVMIAFTLFDVATGAKVMVLIQALIGGVATYLFGRRIGFIPLAALFSGLAFAIGPVLYGATGYITVVSQVNTFIPLGLMSAEGALRARSWSALLGWSALTGLAISQMFVSWPGQGLLYGSMYIVGWMAYRWLIAPVPGMGGRRTGFQRVMVSGVASAVLAATFGAAGILPRLDFSAQSTIPGGDYSNVIGGDRSAVTSSLQNMFGLLFQDSLYPRFVAYSAQIIVLALFAILVGRGQFAVPFFAGMAVLFIDLAVDHSLTRWLFYLIPGFELIHGHRPNVTVWMLPTAMAMLAGAGFQAIVTSGRARSGVAARLLPLLIALLAIITVERAGISVGWWPIWIGGITTLLMILPVIGLPDHWHPLRQQVSRYVPALLLVLLLAYPNGVDVLNALRDPDAYAEYGGLLARNGDIDTTVDDVLGRTDSDGAGAFLQRQQSLVQPFRYAPYTGTGGPDYPYGNTSYRRLDPAIVAILANGRSARLGLEQTSGYNPLHLKHYVEYVDTMNGAPQDYHWLDLMPPAVSGTPLLDMLNVRYVLVPAALGPQPPIATWGEVAWRDEQVIVYENPNALPRAWVVHEVADNRDGEGLRLLNSGRVDPRQVAFVDGSLPEVTTPLGSGPGDEATITSYEPERIEVSAKSRSAGLLVLSEVYANGWNAYVDGDRVDVLRTNHALRGVPLPAGEHEVVMKYEPRSLTIGLWSTGLTSVAMIGIWGWALVGWRRYRRRPRPSSLAAVPAMADQGQDLELDEPPTASAGRHYRRDS